MNVYSADKVPADDYLYIMNQEILNDGVMPDLSTKAGQDQLQIIIEEKEIDLIIIDNISTLCRTGAENKADDWNIVQTWALKNRSERRSILFVHHTGKGGEQRGTAKREDVLDTVISLKRPSDYKESEGAKFEVKFEKARGITGEDAVGFIAHKQKNGWEISSVEDTTYKKVIELLNLKMSQADIARELKVNRSTVSRHVAKAKQLKDI